MALKINTNVTALNAHRNLLQTDLALSRSIERLSSGLRIVRAADDPAGFVQSEQMRTTIASVGTAIRNITDAVSMIQTTEAVFDEIESLLRTMRSLALHAANTGPNDQNAIEADQAQIIDALNALDQIATTRRFGAKVLLDGSNGKNGTSTDTRVQFVRAGVNTTNSSALPEGYKIKVSIDDGITVTSNIVRFAGGQPYASAAATVTLIINGELVSVQANMTTANAVATIANQLDQDLFGTVVPTLGANGTIILQLGSITVSNSRFGQEFFIYVENLSATDPTGLGAGSRISGASPRASRTYMIAAGAFADDDDLSLEFDEELIINGVRITLTEGMTIGQVITKINNFTNFTAVSAGKLTGSATALQRIILRSTGYGSDFTIQVQSNRNNGEGATSGFGGSNQVVQGEDVDARLFVVKGSDSYEFAVETNGQFIAAGQTVRNIEGTQVNLDGLVLKASLATASALLPASVDLVLSLGVDVDVFESPLRFQIAEGSEDNVARGINNIRPEALGITDQLNNIDVRSIVGAQRAIKVIDEALAQVLDERGQLGAFQRQFLEPFQNNLRVYQENLQAAESNIRDADLAFEMIEFTKRQILLQSGTAMLAQANLSPQSVLQLLR